MTPAPPPFRASYASTLHVHLGHGDEETLRRAYELGREAVERDLSVLDITVLHHDVLVAAMADCAEPRAAARLTAAAGDFLLEVLSALEMVRRGFREARAAALLERRQTGMLRRLSDFLADTSLTLEGSASLEEILRLVAEQACELVRADCALVMLRETSVGHLLEGSAFTDERWAERLRRGEIAAVFPLVSWSGGELRMAGDALLAHPAFRALADPSGGVVPGAWLAAPLTALGGRQLGAIQVLAERPNAFSDEDEAVLAHLAQMVSAAAERAEIYGRSHP